MSTVKELTGDAIAAADGDIGHLEAIYFDDRKWDVRHLVVNATGGISALKVLVSPAAVERAGSSRTALRVALTREQVMHSPPVDRDMPVARQYEEAGQREAVADIREAERQASRSHLRSSEEVIGYSVHGPDGLLGHVDDLVVDDAGSAR